MAFLLSLSETDVLAGAFRSQLAQVTPDGDFAPAAQAEIDPIPTYARWCEVRRARARVEAGNGRVELAAQETLALELRIRGLMEREIAEILSVSTPTAHRRWRALLEEITAELGAAPELASPASRIPACLLCGQRPRARLAARRRRVYGGWKVLAPEKQSSLCRECTPQDRLHLLVAAPGGEHEGA